MQFVIFQLEKNTVSQMLRLLSIESFLLLKELFSHSHIKILCWQYESNPIFFHLLYFK